MKFTDVVALINIKYQWAKVDFQVAVIYYYFKKGKQTDKKELLSKNSN